jgi:hypothetical protein
VTLQRTPPLVLDADAAVHAQIEPIEPNWDNILTTLMRRQRWESMWGAVQSQYSVRTYAGSSIHLQLLESVAPTGNRQM